MSALAGFSQNEHRPCPLENPRVGWALLIFRPGRALPAQPTVVFHFRMGVNFLAFTLQPPVAGRWTSAANQNISKTPINPPFPAKTGGGPLTVCARPLRVRGRPLTVRPGPLTIRDRPLRVGDGPLRVCVRPLRVRRRPLTVRVRPLTVCLGPLRVCARPLRVGHGPLTVRVRLIANLSSSYLWRVNILNMPSGGETVGGKVDGAYKNRAEGWPSHADFAPGSAGWTGFPPCGRKVPNY